MAKLCPSCAKDLNSVGYCDTCKRQIKIYKKVETISKQLYNEGLEHAKIRDISNAISLLNRSLKFNKNNVEARNLLGLLYFEIGETVAALKQWVLSKHLQPSDNKALSYLSVIQENQSHLERLNSAIKKYNQSLTYIKQGSVDLAIIHLKKVISLNTQFVKAYNLLALCYIKDNQEDKAIKVLKKVLAIDKSNGPARKYYNELIGGAPAQPTTELKTEGVKGSIRDRLPFDLSVSSSLQQLLTLIIGVVIGMGVIYFLIMPKEISEKEGIISNLQTELGVLTTNYNEVTNSYEEEQLLSSQYLLARDTYATDLSKKDALLNETSKVLLALNYYASGEKVTAANELFLVNKEVLQDSPILAIYENTVGSIYPEVAQSSYNSGSNYYRNYGSSYLEQAIELLEASIKFGQTSDFLDYAHYYLAGAYRKSGNIEAAILNYKVVAEQFPSSRVNGDAVWWIDELTEN